MSEIPDDAAIEEFWRRARDRARLASLPGYLPAGSLEILTPPSWSFGTDAASDELLDLIVSGRKTATASDFAAYGPDDALPSPGKLDIIVDSRGRPRVLAETTAVQVVPFDRVDAEHARLEGEGDLSLSYWRSEHQRFFDGGGHFAPDMDVVLERFRVLYAD